jgi:hypothetical protein
MKFSFLKSYENMKKPIPGKFDPSQQFDSVQEALDLIAKQPDQVEALKQIVCSNIDFGEYRFAAEVCQDFDTIE